MAQISVIIPNWNGEKLLASCLDSVFKQSFNDFEVIVVDNGSQDGSVKLVESRYPQVHLIALPKNVGFAAAVNLGIKKSRAPFVALLNNDAIVTANWLAKLYQAAVGHPEVFGVAPKIISASMKGVIENAGDKINIVCQAYPIGRGAESSKFSRPGYVFGASGAASLFRRSVLVKLGLFDEDFFFYFEDVDFSFRAQLAGFKCWYEPEAVVYHYGEKSAVRLGDFIEYQRLRNTLYLMIKNLPVGLLLRRGRFWKIPLVLLHTFYFFVKNGKGKYALWAWRDVVFSLPKLLAKRRMIFKMCRVSLDSIDQLMEDKKLKILGWRV